MNKSTNRYFNWASLFIVPLFIIPKLMINFGIVPPDAYGTLTTSNGIWAYIGPFLGSALFWALFFGPYALMLSWQYHVNLRDPDWRASRRSMRLAASVRWHRRIGLYVEPEDPTLQALVDEHLAKREADYPAWPRP